MAKQIVSESDAKSIHGAVQTESNHQHHCRLCQLRICVFEVVYCTSRTDMVDVFADDPKKEISASTRKKKGRPGQELFGIGQYVEERNRQQCAHRRGDQQAESMQGDLAKDDAERNAGKRKQSGYGWVEENNA